MRIGYEVVKASKLPSEPQQVVAAGQVDYSDDKQRRHLDQGSRRMRRNNQGDVVGYGQGGQPRTRGGLTMEARKPSEKPLQWHVEQYADRFPDYWKAEHPCGSEIHVWRGYKREPAWGFEPSPEEPVGWYFEVKGPFKHYNTPYEYEGGKTADEAKAAALAWLEEVIADNRQTFRHWSDCALHNAPAAMPRWCSCDGPKSLTEFLGFWWLWFTRRA